VREWSHILAIGNRTAAMPDMGQRLKHRLKGSLP
jgi:hypothetical protein